MSVIAFCTFEEAVCFWTPHSSLRFVDWAPDLLWPGQQRRPDCPHLLGLCLREGSCCRVAQRPQCRRKQQPSQSLGVSLLHTVQAVRAGLPSSLLCSFIPCLSQLSPLGQPRLDVDPVCLSEMCRRPRGSPQVLWLQVFSAPPLQANPEPEEMCLSQVPFCGCLCLGY